MYSEDEYWRRNKETAATLQALPASKTCKSAYFLALAIQIGFCIWTQSLMLIITTTLFAALGFFMLRKSMQMFSLSVLVFTIVYLVEGVMGFDWGFEQIAALFFTMAIISGMALGKNASEIAKLFIAGAKDMLSAALVVGLASGIIVILEDGKIIDTFLSSLSSTISGSGKVGALTIMYAFQSLLNAIITSGTAKAAMLMPMFAEIANMCDISLQAAVTAFHIGDGFTNLITPTSGVLIAVLGLAKIPYAKWVKFSWKFILAMVVLGWALLLPTLFLSLPDF